MSKKLRAAIIVAILAGAIGIAILLVKTKPEVALAPAKIGGALPVSVRILAPEKRQVIVEAMGTVEPAQAATLQSQVAGRLLWVSPDLTPGGRFAKGSRIAQIDPADYELALEERRNQVATARMNLTLEEGKQAVARREYEALGRELSGNEQALVLRAPQLESATRALAAAEAALKKAELDLARATIVAPFNATVQKKLADVGSYIATAGGIASLVGTDEFFVTLAVPVHYLRWIRAGDKGSAVTLFPGANGDPRSREGTVARIAAELEDQGRLAKVIVRVTDPLCLRKENRDKPPLLAGMYLRAVIAGAAADGVIAIPRSLLREGDMIALRDTEGKLELRTVTVLYRGRNEMLLAGEGLAGTELITTPLIDPAIGAPLTVTEAHEAD